MGSHCEAADGRQVATASLGLRGLSVVQRINSEYCYIMPRMGAARCSVSFTDTDGLSHRIHVDAESLYEAVALAIAGFRSDSLVPRPQPMTEFTVVVERPPVEHRIHLHQVAKWAEETTREGPAGVMKRQRVKALMGEKIA